MLIVVAWCAAFFVVRVSFLKIQLFRSGSLLGGYASLSTIDRSQDLGTGSHSASGYLMPNTEKQNLVIRSEGLEAKRVLTHDYQEPIAIRLIVWKNGQEYTLK